MEMTTARPRAGEKEKDHLKVEPLPMPFDLSAEGGVLGSMILWRDTVGPICSLLKTADVFWEEKHRIIFSVLRELYEKNKPIDAMLLYTALKGKRLVDEVGGVDYIKELAGTVPTSAHAEYYATLVKEAWERRMMISACHANLKDLAESNDDSAAVLNRCEGRIFEVAERSTVQADVKLSEAIQTAMEAMDRNASDGPSGLRTGLFEIDEMIDGMHKGEMLVVGARTSTGKTAFALGIAEHLAIILQTPVGVMSMEMPTQAIGQRMLCSRAGVDSQQLRRGMLSHDERERLGRAVGELSAAPVYIDDTQSQNPMMMMTKGRRMVKQHGIQMLVIDYLQLMQPSKKCGNRQEEMSNVSMHVKGLARELNIPVIALSQLNRASETENRMPRCSDLRESGSIEQDSDVIILLHREDILHRGEENYTPDNLATAIIAKQRNGPCGMVRLVFNPQYSRFSNYNSMR